MTRKSARKITSISTSQNEGSNNKVYTSDEEEGYLPLKYPIRSSQEKCKEKIKNFKIKLEDKKEAGSSKFFNEESQGNLNNYIKEIQKSINFLSEKYDIICKENKKFSKELVEIKKNHEELKKENKTLRNQIENLQKEIVHNEEKGNINSQNLLRNNIEIKGIPQKEDIDDQEIIKKNFNKIGIRSEKEDILEIRREENRNKNENVIKIKLKNEHIKKHILEKSKQYYKNKGKLTTLDINLKNNQNIIYINEELTPKLKYLFGKTKELRKKGFKYIWIKNGKIFVRKNEEEEVLNINNEEKLRQLINLDKY